VFVEEYLFGFIHWPFRHFRDCELESVTRLATRPGYSCTTAKTINKCLLSGSSLSLHVIVKYMIPECKVAVQHSPRLVVCRSTCPPLSPSAHANSFVMGTAVINTHMTRTETQFECSSLVPARRYFRYPRCQDPAVPGH
jgi:hypothetical protein